MARLDGPLLGRLGLFFLLISGLGGFLVILNGAVTGFWMFKNFKAVVSADVVLHQYRWASFFFFFFVMYLRVGISSEDVFAILINLGFERFCSPIPYFGHFSFVRPFWSLSVFSSRLESELRQYSFKSLPSNV